MEFPSSPQWKSTEDEKRGWGESQKWFEGTDKRGWGETQKWFEGTDFTGQPGMNPPNHVGDNMFQLDDVDGMFGPGAYEPQLHLSSSGNPFGGSGGLGMNSRPYEGETSSLLHILGSDLFHDLDGMAGHDDGADNGGHRGSFGMVGRLDELNGSIYVAPGDARAGSLPGKSMQSQGALGGSLAGRSMLAQGPLGGGGARPSHAASSRVPGKLTGYEFIAHGRDGDQGQHAKASVGDQSKSQYSKPNGAHGNWVPENGAPGNYRGGGRGQVPYGYGVGGAKRGGHVHFNGPAPYGGAAGRPAGFNMKHLRGGGPEAAVEALRAQAEAAKAMSQQQGVQMPKDAQPYAAGVGGPGGKPSGGSADSYRNQQHASKGARPTLQTLQQPLMNGRLDTTQGPGVAGQDVAPAARDTIEKDGITRTGQKQGQGSATSTAPDAALDSTSQGPPSGSSVTSDILQPEEAQSDTALEESKSAADKEAADKAKREAKKQNKKEKMRKGKDQGTPSDTPLEDTPEIDAVQPPDQPPPLAEANLAPKNEANADSNQEPTLPSPSGQDPKENFLDAADPTVVKDAYKEASKGAAASSKSSSVIASQRGAVVGSAVKTKEAKTLEKVVPAPAKKQKESIAKKSQQQSKQQQPQHRKGRTVVYESEEEEEAPATSLRSSWQSLKQWALSLGKPQQRRRARSKAYRVWINMGLRVLMAALVISGLTTLIAPGTGRNDSSCRQILESVRRVCQSSLGADCRLFATKVRAMCYITESIPGVRLFESIVLWILRVGRLSWVFSRNANTGNKGLIARCRLLPLQHHCSLGGPGHHDRLRWHLDTVLRLLQLEREGSFSNGLCVGEKCGALSMSRWNSGIRRHTGAYSLLCEQQFGEGAEFDGEMCACRKGYVVRSGMCRKVSRSSAKGASDDASLGLASLDGGSKSSKRLGAAGPGSSAKCAARSKKKSGKARKLKDDSSGGAGARMRHLDALDP